jgi:hypothetical protein
MPNKVVLSEKRNYNIESAVTACRKIQCEYDLGRSVYCGATVIRPGEGWGKNSPSNAFATDFD